MKKKRRFTFFPLIILAASLVFVAYFLSCENKQRSTSSPFEKGIIPKSVLNVHISEVSDDGPVLVFFETTLTPSQIKAYYLSLASKKRWSYKEENLLKDGFVMTFEGSTENIEVSVREGERKTMVTLSVIKQRR